MTITAGGVLVVGGVVVVGYLGYRGGRHYLCWRSYWKCVNRGLESAKRCAYRNRKNSGLDNAEKLDCYKMHVQFNTSDCNWAYANCKMNGWWQSDFPKGFHCLKCDGDGDDDSCKVELPPREPGGAKPIPNTPQTAA